MGYMFFIIKLKFGLKKRKRVFWIRFVVGNGVGVFIFVLWFCGEE